MPRTFLTIMAVDLAGVPGPHAQLAEAVRDAGAADVHVVGDHLLAGFASAADAVSCATALQREGRGVRAGLDAGEVEGPMLAAPQVTTASRLAEAAADGEILVSETVRAVAAPHVGDAIRPAGSRRLRGLPEPVAMARVLWREEEREPAPPVSAAAVTVAIADDQRLLRAGFRVILDAEPGITVVGEAGDGRAAVDVVLRRRPDVVLMDIRMPELDGLDAAERILSAPGNTTAVVMLTTFDASEYVYRALRIGASGFLLKDTPSDRLIEAVRVAAAGDALIAPSITRRLVEQFSAFAPAGGPEADPRLAELTARELEVLRLIARGLSNSEIARELVLADNTVKTHVARVLSKLGLRDRVQAVVLAYEAGVVRPGA